MCQQTANLAMVGLATGSAAIAEIAFASAVRQIGNKIASRIFSGSGDTFTPMLIRRCGAVVTVVLNLVLVFELGGGVAGAEVGTVVATYFVTPTFFVGVIRRRCPLLDPIPIGFSCARSVSVRTIAPV